MQKIKLFLYSSIFILLSCQKESEIGTNIQPADDKIEGTYIDTFSIKANILKSQNLVTSNNSLFLFGSYNDAIFGKSTASVYTQIRLEKSNVVFGEAPLTTDSVVLSLAFFDIYGSKSDQLVEIYELDEDLNTNNYYANYQPTIKITPLAAETITLTMDSIKENGINTQPRRLRIKLSNSFGQKILNESGTSNLQNDASFSQFIKGIYITTKSSNLLPNQGAIFSANLNSPYSKITLYYKDGQNTSKTFDFYMGTNALKANEFTHDYFSTQITQQLNNSELGQNELFLQGMSSIDLKLTLPTIKTWANNIGKVAIHKAELILPIQDASTSLFKAVPLLDINYYKEDATLSNMLLANESIAIYNDKKKYYSAIITSYVQRIINGSQKDYGLLFKVSKGSQMPNRTHLKGAKDIKLKIYYSKLN